MCPCTLEAKYTVTDIGVLSKSVSYIEGIDTGPMWTTHNILNQNSVVQRLIYTNASDSFDLSKNVIVKQALEN